MCDLVKMKKIYILGINHRGHMITLKRKTKTEQNNGITMFNTSNEGTGGLGISYSSSSMFQFYGIFLATFNPCILCHMQISYLMIKSVDC